MSILMKRSLIAIACALVIAGNRSGYAQTAPVATSAATGSNAAPGVIPLEKLGLALRRGRIRIQKQVMEVSGIDLSVGGGTVRGRARIGLDDHHLDANLELTDVRLDRLISGLPKEISSGVCSGTLRLSGVTGQQTGAPTNPQAGQIKVTDIAITIQRGRPELLPGTLRISGALTLSPNTIETPSLQISGDGLSIDLKGKTDLAARRFEISLSGQLRRLATGLKLSGLSRDLLSSVSFRAQLSGPFADPKWTAEIATKQVRTKTALWPHLSIRMQGTLNRATVSIAESKLFDGKLKGDLSIAFKDSQGRFRPWLSRGALSLSGAALSATPGIAPLFGEKSGRFNLGLSAHGALFSPDVTATLDLIEPGQFAGFPLQSGRAALKIDSNQAEFSAALTIATGGQISASGHWFRDDDRIAAKIATQPPIVLSALPALENRAEIKPGDLSLSLSLIGTLSHPVLVGEIAIAESELLGEKLGKSSIQISAGDGDGDGIPDGAQLVLGQLLGDRVRISGGVELRPLRTTLSATIDKLALQQVWPVIGDLGAKAVVTGELSMNYGMADSAGKPMPFEAHALLRRFELTVAQWTPKSSRHTTQSALAARPLVFTTESAEVSYRNGVLATLADKPITILGPQSRFTLSGEVSSNHIAALAQGKIELALIELYTRGITDSASGALELDVAVSGTPADPSVTGLVSIADAAIVPHGVDTARIHIPSGAIQLRGDRVQFDDLVVEVIDEAAGRRGQSGRTAAAGQPSASPRRGRQRCARNPSVARCLFVTGEIGLKGFAPETIAVRLHGTAGAKLLSTFLPTLFADAQGSAFLDLTVGGTLRAPIAEGSISFDNRPLDLVLRRLQRDLLLDRGSIVFTKTGPASTLATLNIGGRIDDSRFSAAGSIEFANGIPVRVRIDSLRGEAISLRKPGVFEVEADYDVAIQGDENDLRITGEISIADGRYVESLSVAEAIFLPRKLEEEAPPFWKGSPWIEHAKLDLSVVTAGDMVVKNNIADLSLSGRLTLSGELGDPRLDGIVRVEQGTFHIPFLRGSFTVQSGSVYFDKDAKMPYETPRIDISAETLFEDRSLPENDSEREHLIQLVLTGPLADVRMDLSSNTGRSRAELISLLALGRSTAMLRAQARGDQSMSAYSGGARGESVLTVGDEVVKEFTGDVIGLFVDDPLRKLTTLDIVRFRLSPNGVEVEIAEKFGRYVQIGGLYDWQVGQERREVYGTARLSEHAYLELRAKRLLLGQEIWLENEQGWKKRGQLNFRWKIR